jgi:hypothetical protein
LLSSTVARPSPKKSTPRPGPLRHYIITTLRTLTKNPIFKETLSGHLPSDSASQQRLPRLRDKLNAIAALK